VRDAPRRVRRDHHPSNCWPPCTAEELSHRVDRHHGALVKLAPRADELARPCPDFRSTGAWDERKAPRDAQIGSSRPGRVVPRGIRGRSGRGEGRGPQPDFDTERLK
jgi:hypothetical protein